MVMQAKSARQEDNKLILREVSILEMNKDTQVERRIEAYLAVLSKGRFELKGAQVFVAGRPRETINSMDYHTTLTIDRIKENFIAPEAISFWRLPATIHFYEMSGFAVGGHYMRYLSLLVSPFLLCAMVLVAAVFALRPNTRKGGALIMIVGGVTVGFVVYFFSHVIYAFGANNYIPAIMAAWTPALVVAMFSISVLLHLEDG
jgi:lipopolysaccharide export system permease protein